MGLIKLEIFLYFFLGAYEFFIYYKSYLLNLLKKYGKTNKTTRFNFNKHYQRFK